MGTPCGTAQVSEARDAILGAIRRANVPTSSPATPVVRPASSNDLVAAFIAVLPSVASEGAIQTAEHSVEHCIRAWFPATDPQPLVVRARCAVAENGAVYLESQDLSARSAIVLAEHVVVLVSRERIVPTMHEAISQLNAEAGCGWFLSGPSKTADIEQSLVIGAQGARTLRVIITD